MKTSREELEEQVVVSMKKLMLLHVEIAKEEAVKSCLLEMIEKGCK